MLKEDGNVCMEAEESILEIGVISLNGPESFEEKTNTTTLVSCLLQT